jgi:hypothetical protein
MNRHLRRRAAKLAANDWLHNLQRLQEASIISDTFWALQLSFRLLHSHSDPEMLAAFRYWTQHIPINRPMCLTCRHKWLSLSDGIHYPPAALVFLAPWSQTGDLRIVCAVCSECAEHPELGEKIENSIRKFAPDAQFHDVRASQ